ncbi:MAG: cytochrome C biogenesis protein [Clostridiales bacterium]|nr:cytochrome C biogenesis protein [Clostridiales bacterium]
MKLIKADMVKLEIFLPPESLENVAEALRQAGAGKIGNYDSCLSATPVKGRWRPMQEANPYNGEIGKLCEADELKVEVNCPLQDLKRALEFVRAVHPYEEPVINVIPLAVVDA